MMKTQTENQKMSAGGGIPPEWLIKYAEKYGSYIASAIEMQIRALKDNKPMHFWYWEGVYDARKYCLETLEDMILQLKEEMYGGKEGWKW